MCNRVQRNLRLYIPGTCVTVPIHEQCSAFRLLPTVLLTVCFFQSLLRADADHLKKLMSSKTRRSTFSYDNLKRLMESLMYKYDHDIEERKTNDNITGRKYSLDMKPEKPQLLFKHPYKQLMVWSILMLR